MRSLRDIEGLHPSDLSRRQRLLLVYLTGITVVILAFTAMYYVGVHRFEGRDYTIFRSFQTVVETMTTTGYGADSPWSTPVMNLFMVSMQVTGIVIGLVTLRVLIIPLYEQTSVNLDEQLTPKDDHVVVAEYQRNTEVLLNELEELDVDYVLLDADVDNAERLSDAGYQAIEGDPEMRANLDRAAIERARLLITDAGDRTASVVLTALEANDDLRVISFMESARRQAALAEVGVDRSIAPATLIGHRLAEKATTPVVDSSAVTDGDERVAIREVLVRHGSELRDVRIGESPLARYPDLTLVAGWFDGDLVLSPSPDDRLTPNAVLVVAGPMSAIDDIRGEMANVRPTPGGTPSRILVAGYGEGGAAAVDALPDDASVTTIDRDPATDPDVVGDLTEPEALRAADVDEASAVVVTVDDDATALLTVAIARSLSSDVEILARVTDASKASPAFRAGADYVLSVQRVSARLVAAEALGERVMDPVNQIRLVRTDAGVLVGESLGDTRRDTERGWTIVGVSRDGRVLTDDEIVVEPGDDVFVAGGDESIQSFEGRVEDVA